MIGMGKLKNNLYFLEVAEHKDAATRSLPSMMKCNVWHVRFDHPSSIKLQILHKDLHILVTLPDLHSHYRVCHIAKQKRLPFHSRNNMCAELFDLIHMDTWGPFQVSTIEGHKYFLTLVDDCSQATWTSLMHAKSDVLSIFPTSITLFLHNTKEKSEVYAQIM